MSTPTVTFAQQRVRGSASELERARQRASPELPQVLKGTWLSQDSEPVPADAKFTDTIRKLFPATCEVPKCTLGSGTAVSIGQGLKVGVVLSGGQAPGGHNVIAGIFDAVHRTGSCAEVFGFCDGPHGVFSGNVTRIDEAMMDSYRNTGGFDMIGSGRHKIESEEQFQASKSVCEQLALDGLVVIGGDDSNTNAALLAEYFKANNCKTNVVGCPKTIDGDLKCIPEIPVSFGFDTACRTFAELVGNVAIDAVSTQKYYHFVRLMGRSASNIALEVALLTNPNVCFIGEEVEKNNFSLKQLTDQIVSLVVERAKLGKSYGVVVIPEGLIEFIPEFNAMIAEINELGDGLTEADVLQKLSPENVEKFRFLPEFIRGQLLLDRDPHGNVQVTKIETEKLLAGCVEQELEKLQAADQFKGTFRPQFHSFGYEGRAGLPSRFDGSYCYALGYTAGALLAAGRTGLISSVKNLSKPVEEWSCGGVPVTSLCVVERRKGKDKPVIKKALVELDGPNSQPFKAWESMRDRLALEDAYLVPGPLQFDISCPVSLQLPVTLALELGAAHTPPPPLSAKPVEFGGFLHCPKPLSARSQLQQWRTGSATLAPDAMNVYGNIASSSVGEPTQPPLQVDGEAVRDKLPLTFEGPLVDLRQGPLMKPTSIEDSSPTSKTVPVSVPHGVKIGVVFCGRQAPGGHDVVFGAMEVVRNSGGEVYGFVGGAVGLFEGHAVPLNDVAEMYRGTGGFELLGRTQDRTAASEEEKAKVLASCQKLGLTGLLLVGGTRTATDAAYLAEYFAEKKATTNVVVVPCGIEGSLLNPFVEVQLGFDSASKTMAQLIANTCTDGASARKYYYFLRVMDGSSTGTELTSHLSLEVALATRPNVALIGEEIAEKRLQISDLVHMISDMVCARAHEGKNFGTVLVPEGLFAAVNECRVLLEEIAKISTSEPLTLESALSQISEFSGALLKSFPSYIQRALLLERQSNGHVQLSQVQTEQLLADLVGAELQRRKVKNGTNGTFNKNKVFVGSFAPVCQFVGYQARCSMPSNFDMAYGRALGETAAILAATGRNGYMASVSGLAGKVGTWRCAGSPISSICTPTDKGVRVVPQPVMLQGQTWNAWKKIRERCKVEDLYRNPGPIQLSGPDANRVTETLAVRGASWGISANYLTTLDELSEKIEYLKEVCRPGCEVRLARLFNRTLGSMEDILAIVSEARSA